MIAVNWAVNMVNARHMHHHDVLISGNLDNIDPDVSFCAAALIRRAIKDSIDKYGRYGNILLNLDHDVIQGNPEEAFVWFVYEHKQHRGK